MQNRVSKYYIVGMYVGINFVTKKVISILFALALFSCHPVVNQPTSKSSASDSVELKKQEARVMGTGTLVHSLGAMNLSPMIPKRYMITFVSDNFPCFPYIGN